MQRLYFELSTGLKATITVPIGWLDKVLAHVEWVESTLQIEREQYLNNPPHWKCTRFDKIPNGILCDVAERHNQWVRNIHSTLASNHQEDGEILTPEQAAQFWPGLEMIDVPPERWTSGYYENRMQHLFEVMNGNEHEGISFDARKLTPKQAGAVILLFEEYLDKHDVRLSVPEGYDFLTSDYEWCDKCGKAIYQGKPCNKRKCPIEYEND